MASENPNKSVRPQFDLGGQVSQLHRSHPQLAGSIPYSEEDTVGGSSTALPLSASTTSASTNQFNANMSNARSLNPEYLMREFTTDEQGRMDSNHSSPGSGFKSSFAREVMQNNRKSTSIAEEQLPVNQSSITNNRRSGSYLGNPKYRSQFASRHHMVSF